MACPHVESASLNPPRPSQSVYREDCTQCFSSIDSPAGLDVCLTCFNGGCVDHYAHAALHHQRTSHPLVVNIKRTRKPVKRDEPPQKISKLAIAAETEEDRYDTATQVKCLACRTDDVQDPSGKVQEVVQGILKANTFARQEEVKAWEQEITPCEHTLMLQQESGRTIPSGDLGQCSMCDLKENLWLCLTCGNLGCGRAQFGGVGGNSHGLAHFDSSQHPVSVKLGSLTADGAADIYCYACNDERQDPELVAHLATWGIDIADRVKTEKSLTEMQIEQNLRWEFSMTDQEGRELKKVNGPGLTGLKNLGNSCYLASIVQALFAMPEFQERYYLPKEQPPTTSTPAEDLETQLRKMADGLLSGRYAQPDSDVSASEDNAEIPWQKGLAPAMLKHLIGRGHVEFSTMRQQDSYEFLDHLLKLITRSSHLAPHTDPVESFRFVMEQRLQCLECHRVSYRSDIQENIPVNVPIRRVQSTGEKMDVDTSDSATKKDEEQPSQFEPVTLKECLDTFTALETVEMTCPACFSPAKQGFSKRTLFATFPRTLAINARRFELVNWVPTKLDVPIIVDDAPIDFSAYKSPGHQPDEELLPDDAAAASSTSAKFTPHPESLAMLEAMGFPRVRCEKALHATGNNDAEAASNWLFAHMEDPDIDTPVDLGGGGDGSGGAGGAAGPSAEQIALLTSMGFNEPQARQALKETGGDPERAVDWLFSHPDATGEFTSDEAGADADAGSAEASATKQRPGSEHLPAKFQLQSIVCHKGSSIHAGHYVAFIRKTVPEHGNEPAWVLFNDEKVAVAAEAEAMKRFAYIYFFRRV